MSHAHCNNTIPEEDYSDDDVPPPPPEEEESQDNITSPPATAATTAVPPPPSSPPSSPPSTTTPSNNNTTNNNNSNNNTSTAAVQPLPTDDTSNSSSIVVQRTSSLSVRSELDAQEKQLSNMLAVPDTTSANTTSNTDNTNATSPSSSSSSSSSLPPSSPLNQSLSSPSSSPPQRRLLYSGALSKRSPSGLRLWQNRYFLLYTDNLQYFKNYNEKTANNNNEQPQGILLLSSLKLVSSVPGTNKFSLVLGEESANGRTFELQAKTMEEKERWMTEIQNAMKEYAKHKVAQQSSGTDVKYWKDIQHMQQMLSVS